MRDTLLEYGYADAAVDQFVTSAIAPIGGDDHKIESYLNGIASNYYMQYLAIKLEQYGFDLNRPDLPAQQLSRADNLIKGKLGNPPLDSLYVVQFLESWVVHIRKKHAAEPMNWNDLYEYVFSASDGVSLQGCEMVKALVRSDRIFGGTAGVHYRHRFQGINFRTISMSELMAHILPEVCHAEMQDINRYGRAVTSLAMDKVKNILKIIDHLPQPRFDHFFQVNTHHRIMQVIHKLRFVINEEAPDLAKLDALQQALTQERYARHVYPDDWQRFLMEMETALEAIATPYQDESATNQPPSDTSFSATSTTLPDA